jgi:hypothetical protein
MMKKIKLILLALTILSAKFYAQVPSYVPTTGLVGWWPFNGNANDASVNSINGINYGATLTTDRSGNSNSAYLFSGAQWIQCGYNPILNVGSGSFTLSCWATKTGGNTFQHFITRNEITAWPNATTSYALRYQGPGVGIYASGNATNSNGSIATSSLSNLSNWNHFIGVYNATTGIISVYVNGVLSITSPIAANPQSYNNNGGLFFGVEHPTVTLPSGPQFLSGKLDDIGIWNRALTQNEITALYTNTPPPTFSIQANGCPNVSYQPTNFTPNAGSTYQWTITPSAGAQNSTGLNTANPTFIFNSGGTYSITVQETNNGNTLTSTSASISILNLTNITPSVDGSFLQVINGVNTFSICTGPNTTSALVYNENWGMMNPPNTTYSYTVNNGAQTPITTSATVPIMYGNNNFTLTATSGVCALTNTINIYSGANPFVALGASNTINLCPGSTVNFVIDPTPSTGVNNSPGTTYSMVFSDNLASTLNISNLINDTIIPHQYNVTSCGMTYPGNLYPANTFYAQAIAQNACGITQSSYSPITVHNSTTASFTVSDSTICAGESITLTNIGSTGSVVGMNAPYNCTSQGKFYWTISGGTSGVNYTLISGVLGIFNSIFNNPNGSTNTVGMGSNSLNIQFLTPGIYTITQHYYNSCGTKTFVRNIQVGGITAGANQSVCLGDSVTLTASGGSNYTWNGGIQNGVSFTPTSTQTYTVTGTATGGCPNTSSTTVTVNSVPSANAGNDFTINCSLNPNGSTIGMLNTAGNTYSWTPTAGLSSASVANPTANPSSSTTYTLLVTNANGCTANDQVVVAVNNTPPTISTPPISSQSICVGGAASTLNVVVSGGTGVPTYQWFTVNGSTSTPIPGATNASYTPPGFNIAGTYNYTVMVSQAINGCNTTSSNSEIIVVADPIVSAPLNAAYCQNGVASPLNVTVSGGINTSYSYQWYINTNNSNVGGTIIAGANSPTYIPPTSTVGTYFYYCIVTNNPTSTGCSTSSPVAQIVIVSSPAFTNQPQSNQSTCTGGILNALNVAYTGGTGTATFQWYSNTTNSNFGGTAIPGATSATYVPQSNSAGTVYYYCVISFFSMGSCQSITSIVSTVTVLSTTTVNPVLDQTICAGTQTSPINFSGTPGATYSWTNSNTSIGLAPSGNGNIPTFIAQNNSPFTIIATIIVTPSLTTGNQTCVGTPEIFTITVHPIPLVAQSPNQVVCCQTSTSPIMLVGNAISYFWSATSNSSLLTGYPTSGNSNIPGFIPINNDSITHQIDFVITPTSTYNNLTCMGQQETVTIFVLPCLTVDSVPNIERCSGEHLNEIVFSGNANSFIWTNSNINNGLALSGMGNIPDMLVNNSSNAPINSQVMVSPYYIWQAMPCPGPSITFNLTIYPSPVVNAGPDQAICNGESTVLTGSGANTYVWNNGVDNGVPFAPFNSTSYIVTGTDVNGCVNSDTIQINVNTPSSSTVNINSCDSYTLNGQTYNSGGIYTQVIPNAAGCDSTITLDLTLNYSPSTPIVTIQNEVNLSTSNNTGVTYQWIQCSDLTAIAGQINSSFNPTVNGLYAVVATNSCGSDTSDCADVSTIGFFDMKQYQILVYPNPNNGEFYIEIPSELLGQLLRIVDINGRLIKSIKVNKLVNSIDILDLARGSYWLQIDSQQPIQILKQ